MVKGTRVEVDHCPSCSGYWFDDGELTSVLGPVAPKRVEIPSNARRNEAKLCPRCETPLSWFCFPGTTTVVDACERCHGIWMDGGEGKRLRQSLSAPRMTCPSCQRAQPKGETCAFCGIVVARWHEARSESPEPKPEDSAPEAPADSSALRLRVAPEHYASFADFRTARRARRHAGRPKPTTVKAYLLQLIDDSLDRLLS